MGQFFATRVALDGYDFLVSAALAVIWPFGEEHCGRFCTTFNRSRCCIKKNAFHEYEATVTAQGLLSHDFGYLLRQLFICRRIQFWKNE